MERPRLRLKGLPLVLVLISLLATACGSGPSQDEPEPDKLRILTTYSIVYDLVSQVTGDRAHVESLLAVGMDPHTYEPRPTDLQKVEEADVVFYHGLNLEMWFQRFMETAADKPVYAVTEGIEPLFLEGGTYDGLPDPHTWMDVKLTMKAVENIRDALSELDPDGQPVYEENARRYLAELEELEEWIHEQVETIPPQRRLLVTTDNAFRYFARAYGFEILGFIYFLAPEDEPTPRHIAELIDRIKEAQLPAVFTDTTMSSRLLEQVAADSGARIAGTLYVDSLGPEGSDGDTYIKMMRWNVNQMVQGLKED